MSDLLLALLPLLAGSLVAVTVDVGGALWGLLALTAAQSVALLGYRRFPLTVFVIVTGIEVGLALLKLPIMVGVLVATSRLGGWGRGRRSWIGVLLGVVALLAGMPLAAAYSRDPITTATVFAALVVLFVGFWVVGRLSGRQRDRIRGLQERSRKLEAERELVELRAAERERALLARELHDILNHSVTFMVVDAEAAADTGEGTEEALRRVATTGRESLQELRRLLGVLRTAPDDHDPLRPPPTLAQLDALVAAFPGGPRVRLVGAAEDLVVVGAVGDGAEAVAEAGAHRPDVVLMDIRMPGVDGIEATRQIVAGHGADGTRVLILTTYDLDSYVYAGLQAGAIGFLLKDAPGERIRDGIRVVANGQSVLAPEATARMIEALQPRMPSAEDRALLAAVRQLTDRERQVCELIAEGMSNTDIAHRLVISRYTVKVHVSSVLAKLGLRDRVHVLLAWSRLRGLLPP